METRQHTEERSWTLDELSARVALALSVDYDGQPSGRVREIPDGRIVRYYTTLGLVDRPSRYERRVAIYSTRHLRQIVAIKRLQQTGRSLAEIQQVFATLDERALERLAAVPAEVRVAAAERPEPTTPRARVEDAPVRRDRFWSAAPAQVAEAVFGGDRSANRRATGMLTGVPISGHAIVLAELARRPDAADIEALRAAAAPLLAVLAKRGLI